MQKWEYLRLDVFYQQSQENKGVKAMMENYVDVLTNVPFSDVHDYVNKLGKEGWEMVNYTYQQGLHGSYYFKRPIE